MYVLFLGGLDTFSTIVSKTKIKFYQRNKIMQLLQQVFALETLRPEMICIHYKLKNELLQEDH